MPADLSYSGVAREAVKPVDACLADLIAELNEHATTDAPVTAGCCCGHGAGVGEIILADGRSLLIPNPLRAMGEGARDTLINYAVNGPTGGMPKAYLRACRSGDWARASWIESRSADRWVGRLARRHREAIAPKDERVCECGATPDGTESAEAGNLQGLDGEPVLDEEGRQVWICLDCWSVENYGVKVGEFVTGGGPKA